MTTMNNKLAAAIMAVLATVAAPAAAQSVAGAFGKGRTHFVLTASSGYAFDESYFVLGLGASYYLIDGLSAGLFIESWSGADPGMTKITTSLQYVLHRVQTVKPYIGTFYRRTDIESLPDLDSVGARAGVYVQAGRNAYIGLGGVYESYLDCNEGTYRKCDSTYADVTFTIAF
jgi:hypothetical protein